MGKEISAAPLKKVAIKSEGIPFSYASRPFWEDSGYPSYGPPDPRKQSSKKKAAISAGGQIENAIMLANKSDTSMQASFFPNNFFSVASGASIAGRLNDPAAQSLFERVRLKSPTKEVPKQRYYYDSKDPFGYETVFDDYERAAVQIGMHIRNATNNENGLHEFGATIICNNRSKTCTAGGLSKGSIDRVGSSAWAVPSGLFTLGEAFLEDNIIGKAAIHSHTRLSARDDGMHEGLREYSLELGSRLSPRDFRTLSELEPIGGFRRYGLYNEDNSTLTLVKMDEALVPPFNEVELVECETSDKSKATYGNAYRNTQTIEAMRNFIDENTARGKIQITNYKLNDDYAELCEKDCGNKDGKYFLEDYYEPWSTIFSKDGTGCSYEPEPIAF